MSDMPIVRREIRNFNGQAVLLELNVSLASQEDMIEVDDFISWASSELAEIDPEYHCPHIFSGRDNKYNPSPFVESVPVVVLVAAVLTSSRRKPTPRLPMCLHACFEEAVCWNQAWLFMRSFEPELI